MCKAHKRCYIQNHWLCCGSDSLVANATITVTIAVAKIMEAKMSIITCLLSKLLALVELTDYHLF